MPAIRSAAYAPAYPTSHRRQEILRRMTGGWEPTRDDLIRSDYDYLTTYRFIELVARPGAHSTCYLRIMARGVAAVRLADEARKERPSRKARSHTAQPRPGTVTAEVLATVPSELRPHFEALLEQYRYYARIHHGHIWASPKVIRDLVVEDGVRCPWLDDQTPG